MDFCVKETEESTENYYVSSMSLIKFHWYTTEVKHGKSSSVQKPGNADER